ncbi:unnamed protein product [Adineta steineri]|uniref:Uncharacterized protein n=1 Tax=Adineta steineri TaxID=433720 RepID=A0A819TR35_9BILA|nr:unnamed protein product [Adineta steineri]CAF4083587.1 unnamed protein product [Adineta steineri]
MLLYLFITCHILYYSVSCAISCYDCPASENVFNYNITNEHMTEKPNDCVLKTMDQCTVDIVWQYSIGKKEIVVTGGVTKKSISTNHVLNVAIGYEYRDELVAKKVLEYKCSTDECNSFGQIKRLINSLTVTHHLDEVGNMIKP